MLDGKVTQAGGGLAAMDPHIQPGRDGEHSGGAHTWTSS